MSHTLVSAYIKEPHPFFMETQILFAAIETGALGLVKDLVNNDKEWLKAVEEV